MRNFATRLGLLPSLVLGFCLVVLGLMAMNHIVDQWWPFDVTRLDLVRATAIDRLDPTSVMQAANKEIIFAFLAAVLLTTTGLALPLTDYLNRRFGSSPAHFLVILRQAMWFGFWVAFCMWLQVNRMMGLAIAILVGAVLILFEFLLQVRTRAARVTS
jgi:hypothetical protein